MDDQIGWKLFPSHHDPKFLPKNYNESTDRKKFGKF